MAKAVPTMSAPSHLVDEADALPLACPLDTTASGTPIKRAKIAIVDDEPINVKVVRKYLATANYERFITTTNATEALDLITCERPDLVLLDVMMPDVSGLDILAGIRANADTAHTPVLILTAHTDPQVKQEALELGATDFLLKPVDRSELILRVRNALTVKEHRDHIVQYAQRLEIDVQTRTEEVRATQLELIHCLGRAAEYRDNETGRHVIRVGYYVGIIARELGLDDASVTLLEHASPLHDVGKIGISDAILLKPGKLMPDEYEIIQTHCQMGKNVLEPMSNDEWLTVKTHSHIGFQILSDVKAPTLKIAASIALTHHEKWDGTGYPLALAGEDIPIEGRITAVADVYDALSSKRPYKPAFPREKCFAIMKEQRGRHFDPDVLNAFFARTDDVVQVQMAFADL